MTIWRTFLGLIDPESLNPDPTFRKILPESAAEPAVTYGVPLTITEVAMVADALSVLYPVMQTVEAHNLANDLCRRVGVARGLDYTCVPIPLDLLGKLDFMSCRMVALCPDAPELAWFRTVMRHAQVLAGMAPIRGWTVIGSGDGSSLDRWLNGEPDLSNTRTSGDLPMTEG